MNQLKSSAITLAALALVPIQAPAQTWSLEESLPAPGGVLSGMDLSVDLLVTTGTQCPGRAYIYERGLGSGAWSQVVEVPAPGDVDSFSQPVLGGETLAVGAPYYTQQPQGTFDGLAYDPTSDTLYGAQQTHLFVVDRSTGQPSLVQPYPYGIPCDFDYGPNFGTIGEQVTGLAFDPQVGVLYAVAGNVTNTKLIRIDPSTAIGTELGELGIDGVRGLTCDPATGLLWGTTNGSDELLSIDPVSVTATVIGPLGFNKVKSLAWNEATGTLVGVDDATDDLISIDPATGAGTSLGPTYGYATRGLASDASTGRVYGTTTSYLYEVDPSTWSSTLVGPYATPDETGAIFVFEQDNGGPNQWGLTAFLTVPGLSADAHLGSHLDLDGETLIAGSDECTYIFERSGGVWSESAKLDIGAGSVVVSGDTAAVTSGNSSPLNVHVGVFERNAGGIGAWGQVAQVISPDSVVFSSFGWDLGLDGDVLVIGAKVVNGLGAPAYVFERDAGGTDNWGHVASIQDLSGNEKGSVAVSGDTILMSVDGSAVTHVVERNAGGIGAWGTVEMLPSLNNGNGDLDIEKNRVLLAGFNEDVEIYVESGAVSYCTAGTTTNGCQATLTATGTASASAGSGFLATTAQVEGQKQGLLYFSTAGPKATPWGSGSSYQCLKGPHLRTSAQSSGGTAGQCNGTFNLDFNAWMAANPAMAPVGTDVWMQAWFRDPSSPKSTSFSDAIQFGVCP